jgi:hypothetical protein
VVGWWAVGWWRNRQLATGVMIGKADSSTDDSYAAASTSPCHHAHRHATTRDSPRQPPENSRNSCTWSISRVTVSTITTVTMLPTAVVQSHAAATSDFIEAGALENAYSNPVAGEGKGGGGQDESKGIGNRAGRVRVRVKVRVRVRVRVRIRVRVRGVYTHL